MIKKIILWFFILLSFQAVTFAWNDISSTVENWFNSYAEKTTKNYDISKKITFFEKFSNSVENILVTKNFTTNQKKIVWDIIKLSNDRIFNLTLINKEKDNKIIIKSNKLINWFKNISYNKDHIFYENWEYKAYIFKWYLTFPEWSELRDIDLEYNWINKNNALLYVQDDWNIAFVKDYKKIKLISEDIVFWIAWKYNFLKELKDDKRNLAYETDDYFKKLKTYTLEITAWKSKQEKIKSIYNYILENINYSTSFSTTDYKIFSWIDTYKNNSWVCEWYVKLMLYMLNFAWINNSEVIRWYVIDAEDFPEIWHAWLKIDNKYYDPTFDDPVWATETKKDIEYKYFWLPYDLFYTNRYTFENIPEFLKQKGLEYREDLIRKKLAPLVSKYKDDNYNILKPFIFKLNNNIDINKALDINDIKSIIWLQTVENFKFIKDSKKYSIKSYKYYIIDDYKIDNLIEQLNFNLDWYYLFYWKDENWKYDYRLAYDVEFW